MNYNFRGTYSSAINYAKLDVVIFKKDSLTPKRIYLCLTAHTSSSPQEPSTVDTTYWGIMNTDSNFPETVDSFIRNKNMSPSDVASINRYQELFLKTSRTPTEDTEMNTIANNLRDKQISIEDFNQLKSSIENLQFFFKNDVEGYVNTRKAEFDNAISEFKDVGAFSYTTNYIGKNMVKFNGNIYIAKVNSYGQTPIGNDDDFYWRLLSTKGDTGQAGMSVMYKGDYNNSTAYTIGDGVTYASNLYYAKLNATGILPTNSTHWQLADKVFVGIAPPAAPQTNQAWLDVSGVNPNFRYWNGTEWIDVNAGNSDKLGGQLPTYYATASTLTTHESLSASESIKGHIELATAAETTAGIDNTIAVHPAGLKVELDKKAVTTRNITAGNGLTGGGTLAADRTLTLGTPTTLTPSTTNASTATSHTHDIDTATQAEAQAGSINTKFVTPLRVKEYMDTRLENNLEFRVVAGQLQALIGGVWSGVGANLDKTACTALNAISTVVSLGTAAYVTILDITGKGYMDYAIISANSTEGVTMRITLDGVIVFHGTSVATGKPVGFSKMTDVLNQNTLSVYFPITGAYAPITPSLLRTIPYTLNESVNDTIAINSDSLYFKNSFKIEVKNHNSAYSQNRYSYMGGVL